MTDPGPAALAVVIITTFYDEAVVEPVAAGASGFLLKSSSSALVAEAVRVAAVRDRLVVPEVTGRLLERLGAAGGRGGAPPSPWSRSAGVRKRCWRWSPMASPTPRSRIGCTCRPRTVKSHVNSMLTKLGARDRVELAAFVFDRPGELISRATGQSDVRVSRILRR